MNRATALILWILAFSGYGVGSDRSTAHVISVSGDVEYVHDPSLIKDGNTWYEFGTGSGPSHVGELPIRCSPDLHVWKRCGSVFNEIPEWIKKESPTTHELWAPDISLL